MSKFKIVTAFKKFANLGDEGKCNSFVGMVQDRLEEDIERTLHNRKTRAFELESNSKKLTRKLRDAEARNEAVLSEFDLDKMQSNQDQAEYVDEYLDNIAQAEGELEEVKAAQATLVEKEEAIFAEEEAALAKLRDNLARITAVDTSK